MNHRVKVIVNGRPYLVEVVDLEATPLTVRVNGRSYRVEVKNEDGSAFGQEMNDPETAVPPKTSSAYTLTVPMPGQITDIAVHVGEQVSVGQALCTLDAMKMKNIIRSPRDGIIAGIAVKPGQTVHHGDVLFTYA
jgi:propionyl-CoA carboxylase alpha chain